ncbi:alcohol dehydrogenase catalytic domain-containing protein, partial [Bradyrhizobium sp. 61]|nr:alcohol dehydrogenase catalytic domain-containing protein [Bradyrhizobium sp. 61]
MDGPEGLENPTSVLPSRADLPLTIAGSELAGEVVEVGRHCVGFKVGDRVMALSRG